MVWLSQLAARLYPGLEQRLPGEGVAQGEAEHETGGVPDVNIEGMAGRKWREKEGVLELDSSIVKQKKDGRPDGWDRKIFFRVLLGLSRSLRYGISRPRIETGNSCSRGRTTSA